MKRIAAAELLGTMFLVAAVIGSGIMAARLAGGNDAITLLANSFASATALVALIYAFAPISGAHFNPVVTMAAAIDKVIPPNEIAPRVVAQLAGGMIGVIVAHVMFDLAPLSTFIRPRAGGAQIFSEFIATFGLVAVIHASARRPNVVPIVVGAYIAAAYWFTASTSFANPAVTLARAFTSTFSGIRVMDMPAFIAAQVIGGLVAAYLSRWLYAAAS